MSSNHFLINWCALSRPGGIVPTPLLTLPVHGIWFGARVNCLACLLQAHYDDTNDYLDWHYRLCVCGAFYTSLLSSLHFCVRAWVLRFVILRCATPTAADSPGNRNEQSFPLGGRLSSNFFPLFMLLYFTVAGAVDGRDGADGPATAGSGRLCHNVYDHCRRCSIWCINHCVSFFKLNSWYYLSRALLFRITFIFMSRSLSRLGAPTTTAATQMACVSLLMAAGLLLERLLMPLLHGNNWSRIE